MYRELVIRMGALSPAEGVYTVRVDGPAPGGLPAFEGETRRYDPAVFLDEDGKDLLAGVLTRQPGREQLLRLGTILADLMLPGSIRDVFRDSVRTVREREQKLRLRLLPEAPAFQTLPWEYVYLPLDGDDAAADAGFLALNPDLSIVRHDPDRALEPRLSSRDNVRFIVALAEPNDQNPLNGGLERDAIGRLFDGDDTTGAVTPAWVEKATRDQLEEALRQPADIFHFGGRGAFDPATRRGSLILEGIERRPDPYEARFLARRLREAGVRLAVLGACTPGRSADEDGWYGVATTLIRQGVAAVIAGQTAVRDQHVGPLLERLYPLVLNGRPVDEAVAEARRALYERDGLARGEWGSLVLHMQAHSGVLFPAPERPAEGPAAGQVINITSNVTVERNFGTVTGVQAPGAAEDAEKAADRITPREAPTALQLLLVGRDTQLEEVPPRLQQGRNVYYHGPFGVGKTTLSKALFLRAVHQEKAFADGFMWLDVGDMGVERVLEHIASRFHDNGVARAQGRTEKINALRALLAARPRLLIGLDDVQDRDVARAVLEAAGKCTVLVNSGRALSDPELAEERALTPLAPSLAFELFLREAHIAGDALAAGERDRIEEICERLGYLPLAIHLAASRYAETRRLDQLYRRVMTSPALVATEHEAVANAFQAAFDEVRPHKTALRLLARLTAFPAREADEIALQEGVNRLAYFQAVDKLLALGLLSVSAAGRLALHPLLGALSELELDAALLEEERGDAETWLLAYAQAHRYDYDALAGEHQNLVGLLDRLQEEEAEALFRLLHDLFPYFRVRGHWHEAREQLGDALAVAQARSDALAEARVRLDRGVVLLLQGENEVAAADLEAAAVGFREEGAPAEEGKAVYHLARIAAGAGEWAEAEEGYREAIRLLESGEAVRELVGARANLGQLVETRGEQEAAREQVEQALALAETLGDREWLATLHNVLGKFARQAGEAEAALDHFREALAMATALGAPRVQAAVETQLGHTFAYQDRFEDAVPHYQQALTLYQALQDPAGEASTAHDLGNVALSQGQFDEARDYYEAALAINRRIGKAVSALRNRYQLALVAQRRGEAEVAREQYEAVLDGAQALPHQRMATAAAHQLARLAWKAGELETADEHERVALKHAEETADPRQIATVLHTRGLIRRDKGDLTAARADLTRALELYRGLGSDRATRVEASLAALDGEDDE